MKRLRAGGGENEGAQGAHALFEQRNPAYVRRRCLAHLPWRVADQGLKEVPDLHDELKSISEYLHEGSTWLRLQAIAVQSAADGGLGVCADGDPLYRALFREAPPKEIKDRPATTASVLRWLIGRPLDVLGALVRHDVEQRQLTSKAACASAAVIGLDQRHVLWRVCYVLLGGALGVWCCIEGRCHVRYLGDLVRSGWAPDHKRRARPPRKANVVDR